MHRIDLSSIYSACLERHAPPQDLETYQLHYLNMTDCYLTIADS